MNKDFFYLLKSLFQKRFRIYETQVFGKKIKSNDSLAFLVMYEEILVRKIYQFRADPTQALRIIDAGSNIGLSLIFFKTYYSNAQVIGFEPDPAIAALARYNLAQYGFNQIEIIEKALWKEKTNIQFNSYGAAGSRIDGKKNSHTVQTTVLSEYLDSQVDFLKIDIEGAEIEVLRECRDKLQNVQNLFVEYHSFVQEKQVLPELLAIITQAGFRYYLEHNGVYSNQPYLAIQTLQDMDTLLNIYAYRS